MQQISPVREGAAMLLSRDANRLSFLRDAAGSERMSRSQRLAVLRETSTREANSLTDIPWTLRGSSASMRRPGNTNACSQLGRTQC
jgi:hypothetical protein